MPHPASDLLQTLLDNLKTIESNLKNIDKLLSNIGSIEVDPDYNFYVCDYSDFDSLKDFIKLLMQILEVE